MLEGFGSRHFFLFEQEQSCNEREAKTASSEPLEREDTLICSLVGSLRVFVCVLRCARVCVFTRWKCLYSKLFNESLKKKFEDNSFQNKAFQNNYILIK